MNTRPTSRLLLASLAVFFSQLIIPITANGQAWVPRKRTGTVSVAYRNLFVPGHTDVTGKRIGGGRIRQNVLSTEIDLGLSRRLALNFALPMIYAKYNGTNPHKDLGQVKYIDDGRYHGGFQDFRGGLRYNLVRDRPFVITPFIEGIVPSHGYDVYGHALIGRNLRELLVGTNVGRDLEPWLPNAYFQTRVSYAFVPRVLDISHNRTNIDTEVGFLLTDRVGISGLAHFQKHHGGLYWIDCRPAPLRDCYSDEEWHLHGQLFRSDAFDVGGGISFLVNPTTSVFASLITTPWSRNSHAISTGVTVGINWRFDTRQPSVDSSTVSPPSGVGRPGGAHH